VTSPGEFEQRIADALSPNPAPTSAPVVRQAQFVHTLTEATGQPHAEHGWLEDADPVRRRQSATAVIVSRAGVFVVAYGFAIAIMLAVLVRVLEWIA